jgi:pseudouridine-5'-phosphate glycosidase
MITQTGRVDTSSIEDAITRKQPIVVLESTVLAHGLPWPENLETAIDMERAVAAAGAVPATIAVIDGVARIGLTRPEIERLARSNQPRARSPEAPLPGNEVATGQGFDKASRRDLSAFLARGRSAATTVSATLWLARRGGLEPCVMATGGLGGVHRGADQTHDVSGDLDELSRADGSVVVCSGFKSILDLAATLEVLETRGVCIAGYRTADLPAFTSVSSGLALEHRVESVADAAELVRAHRRIGLPGAIVLANPVPAAQAVDGALMESCLQQALADVRHRKITGKAVTPFLLQAVQCATSGKSLAANRALLVANARLAAELAAALLA